MLLLFIFKFRDGFYICKDEKMNYFNDKINPYELNLTLTFQNIYKNDQKMLTFMTSFFLEYKYS